MAAFIYLFLAYSIIWLGIFGFIWYLNKRTSKLEQDMTLLREMIDAKK